jgi:hypothetical protein
MKLRILGLLAALLIGAAAPVLAQTAPRAPSMAEELEVQALLRGNQSMFFIYAIYQSINLFAYLKYIFT